MRNHQVLVEAFLKLLDEVEDGILIENEGEEPEHQLYSYGGTPLRTLDCSCERCLEYFTNA